MTNYEDNDLYRFVLNQEIERLTERLEELDKQAFLNYIETQEIAYRLKELGREIPEDVWNKED